MDSLAQAGAALHLLQCLQAARVELEQRRLPLLLAPFSAPPYSNYPYSTAPYSPGPYSPCSPLVQASEASSSAGGRSRGGGSDGRGVSNSSTENYLPHSHSLQYPITPPQTEANESRETKYSINTTNNNMNAINDLNPINIDCFSPLNLDAVLDGPTALVDANIATTTSIIMEHGGEIGENLPSNDLLDFLLDVDGDQNPILNNINVNSFDKQIEAAAIYDIQKEKLMTQNDKKSWEPNDFLLAMGENAEFHGNFQTLEMETSTESLTSAKEFNATATTKIPCGNSTKILHKTTKEEDFTTVQKNQIPVQFYSPLTANLKSNPSTIHNLNPNPNSNITISNLDLESYDNLNLNPKRMRTTVAENTVLTETKTTKNIDPFELKENTELNSMKRKISEPTRRVLSWCPPVEKDKGKEKGAEENGNLSDFDEKDWRMEDMDFEDKKLTTSRSCTKLEDFDTCQDKAVPRGSEKKPRQKRGTATDHASVAARNRRGRISKRIRTLQTLIPNTSSLDTAGMLEAAIKYVYHLKRKVDELSN